jgi:hypothetical protein
LQAAVEKNPDNVAIVDRVDEETTEEKDEAG